jgi:hypothetical protein
MTLLEWCEHVGPVLSGASGKHLYQLSDALSFSGQKPHYR